MNRRALGINEVGQLVQIDVEKFLKERIVRGYAVIWGKPNLYGEKFIRGAFAKSIAERGPGSNAAYQLKFLYQHKQDEPLSLFAKIVEDEIGLYFETVELDNDVISDKVLTKLAKHTLNNFSIGFDFIWNKVEWDSEDDTLVVLECKLFEISVVTIPADLNTYAIRSAEAIETLDDDISQFINELPRRHQMEARNLFARQKALVDFDQPSEQREKSLEDNKPSTEQIDYDYLTRNLNLFR